MSSTGVALGVGVVAINRLVPVRSSGSRPSGLTWIVASVGMLLLGELLIVVGAAWAIAREVRS